MLTSQISSNGYFQHDNALLTVFDVAGLVDHLVQTLFCFNNYKREKKNLRLRKRLQNI